MSFHSFIFGYLSHFSNTDFTLSKKRKKNQYLATTSTSYKPVRGKMHDSVLLEFELTDL